ncbi:MAG: hypothetical protein L7F78_19245, partial [Syntrophales bacterium LBB04]|nr:hypothetical protein [Syntrophales bacterium LBB04]
HPLVFLFRDGICDRSHRRRNVLFTVQRNEIPGLRCDRRGLSFNKNSMPSRKSSSIKNPNYKVTGDVSVEAVRGVREQAEWYAFASIFCKNHAVLDVECGLGEGLKILAKEAKAVPG